MSFIKKESNIVEKDLVSKVSDYLPQHPVLQWSEQAVPKRDHLEEYTEVRPFIQKCDHSPLDFPVTHTLPCYPAHLPLTHHILLQTSEIGLNSYYYTEYHMHGQQDTQRTTIDATETALCYTIYIMHLTLLRGHRTRCALTPPTI